MLIPVIARRETRVRYVYWGPVDRHGLRPRDDKSGIFTMKGMKKVEVPILSLRGENEVRDAAIHRVSEDAVGVVCSVTQDLWIATGFQPLR